MRAAQVVVEWAVLGTQPPNLGFLETVNIEGQVCSQIIMIVITMIINMLMPVN
jgi:predicted nuclease of predicted toxin-antitoxin system